LGALNADIPIPLGASAILSCSLTASIYNAISLVAGLTDSFSFVKLTAQIADLAADSILIKKVSVWALEALVLCPGFTSIIIGYID
jgi:hypothetical protein